MDIIILAAGYSSRANTDQTTLIIIGKTMFSQKIETFYPFYENLIVVGGHYYDAAKNLVKQFTKVILVRNNQYVLE